MLYPKEALAAALHDLRKNVSLPDACPECATYVFSKLKTYDQDQYVHYIFRQPRLLDGTRSNAKVNVLCGNPGGLGGFVNWLWCDHGNETVSQFMAETRGLLDKGGDPLWDWLAIDPDDPSIQITYYLEENVFGVNLIYDPPSNNNGPSQCPN